MILAVEETEHHTPAQPVIDEASRPVMDPQAAVPHIKRFGERFRGDAAFRVRVQDEASLAHALRDYGLAIALDDARCYLALERGEAPPCSPAIAAYRDAVLNAFGKDCVGILANRATDERYANWRRRQIAALRFHFSSQSDVVVRPVAAYELSRGCSVGCWFCAVGAEKLQESFLATDENVRLFRSVLVTMRHLFGDAAGSAMCYWATDALDNPDYEVFAHLFAEINHTFPPTTTALAWKSPARTRALLQTAASYGMLLNRFSVLSLGMLNRIHTTFSPEELRHTELVLQMKDALVSLTPTQSAAAKKIRAGRARSAARSEEERYGEEEGTVACVIGFLFNLPSGTVRLITPCPPSEEQPLGYRTLAIHEGLDVNTLESTLQGMMERHMPLHLNGPLRLPPFLSVEMEEGTVTLRSWCHAVTLTCSLSAKTLQQFFQLLWEGTRTAGEIVSVMRGRGVDLFTSNLLIHQLREAGVFDLL